MLTALLLATVTASLPPEPWPATDHLGRVLPGYDECGPPKPDRWVGVFYFLWLGAHAENGPWDVTKILAADPQAMQHPDSPLWGHPFAAHHWGEPLFGYYRVDDPYVLRRHAQVLSAAGVDFVVFDVTNQLTYKSDYMALLKTWAQVRAEGGRTPQVAFLTPFWDPEKVTRELWHDLYEPGLYPELWFRWHGKPLILADPGRLHQGAGVREHNQPARLEPGHTLGQRFTVAQAFTGVSGSFPTWQKTDAAMTLTLRRDSASGPVVATKRFDPVADNATLGLTFDPPLPAGTYVLEMSEPRSDVGWWSHDHDQYPQGQALADGQPVPGDRQFELALVTDEARRLLDFFTFRRPEASYFAGPSQPDMWSWLEVYPQHVFRNAAGEKEQMSVGVAQNAVDNRLGSMSERNSKGRTWHQGRRDTSPGAVDRGPNFAEQWERALAEDPQVVFVTGWNEWIAGRFGEFGGVKEPVMFVDEFDQEHSRDCEPMVGGHHDAYYWQLASYIRRFKGVPRPPAPSPPTALDPEGPWRQWDAVQPEFRADRGDPAHRDHPGYGRLPHYVNQTGRNDIVRSRVAYDAQHLWFYCETAEPLTPPTDPRWMWLLLDVDGQRDTGWEGYEFIVNRQVQDGTATVLEANRGGWKWEAVGSVPLRVEGNRLMVTLPRAALGLADRPVRLDFKWADNVQGEGDIMRFWTDGDVAPPTRFNYRFVGTR